MPKRNNPTPMGNRLLFGAAIACSVGFLVSYKLQKLSVIWRQQGDLLVCTQLVFPFWQNDTMRADKILAFEVEQHPGNYEKDKFVAQFENVTFRFHSQTRERMDALDAYAEKVRAFLEVVRRGKQPDPVYHFSKSTSLTVMLMLASLVCWIHLFVRILRYQ